MRAVIQRVRSASVRVDDAVVGEIGQGLVVLLGVAHDDSSDDVSYLAKKIATLRIFEDSEGKMNLSVGEVGGAILAVSQFTLLGDTRKGRRPSFVAAAGPERAKELYDDFVSTLAEFGIPVATGRFRAHMLVTLVNDGPVTLSMDSRERR